MRWVGGECEISDDLTACIRYHDDDDHWIVKIDGLAYRKAWVCETEEAAKTAVCHWIGRTMAQFSNALAAGYPQVDEE